MPIYVERQLVVTEWEQGTTQWTKRVDVDYAGPFQTVGLARQYRAALFAAHPAYQFRVVRLPPQAAYHPAAMRAMLGLGVEHQRNETLTC